MHEMFYILKNDQLGQSSTVLCAGFTPSDLLTPPQFELLDPATSGARHKISRPTSTLSLASTNKGVILRGGSGPKSRRDIEISIAQNTCTLDVLPAVQADTWLCVSENLAIQQSQVVVRMLATDVQSLAEWRAYQVRADGMGKVMNRERAEMFGTFMSDLGSKSSLLPTISLQALRALPINLESNRGIMSGVLLIHEWLPGGRVRGMTSFLSATSLNLAGATLIRNLSWDFWGQHHELKTDVGEIEQIL